MVRDTRHGASPQPHPANPTPDPHPAPPPTLTQQDIEWFKKEGLETPPLGSIGKEYAARLREIADAGTWEVRTWRRPALTPSPSPSPSPTHHPRP